MVSFSAENKLVMAETSKITDAFVYTSRGCCGLIVDLIHFCQAVCMFDKKNPQTASVLDICFVYQHWIVYDKMSYTEEKEKNYKVYALVVRDCIDKFLDSAISQISSGTF